MRQIKNRLKIRYGRLVVIEFVNISYDGHALWLCRCDCGEETIVRGSDLQSRNTKSCGCLNTKIRSMKCKEKIAEKAPNYIDGRTKEELKIKEEIRKRDNYTCQECSKTQEQNKKETGRILDVHHIDNDNTNNAKENLITLCRPCHGKLTMQARWGKEVVKIL